MSIEPILAKFKCPNCSKQFIGHYPPFGIVHDLNHASGVINSREYFLHLFSAPYLNDYYLCPNCEQLCTADNVIENKVSISSENAHLMSAVGSKRSKMWVLKKLIDEKIFSKYDERSLLLLYWAGVTDDITSLWLSCASQQETVEEKVDSEKIKRLLSLLDEDKPVERLLKIEILRSQKEFDQAEKLLNFELSDKELQEVLEKEKQFLKRKYSLPFIVLERPQIIY